MSKPKRDKDGVIDYYSEREIWLLEGCIDVRKVDLKIPESVHRCNFCGGNGGYRQFYCDAPQMHGPCDYCKMTGFVYRETARGVPWSVTNQIAAMNGLEARQRFAFGIGWKVAP